MCSIHERRIRKVTTKHQDVIFCACGDLPCRYSNIGPVKSSKIDPTNVVRYVIAHGVCDCVVDTTVTLRADCNCCTVF